MYEIKIQKSGKDPEQFITEIRNRIHPDMQNEILLSAQATAEIMRRIIENSGYRLQPLADAINADVLSSTGGISVGIGYIPSFPIGQESGASYWEAFDSGFKVTQANIGYFGNAFRAPESGGYGEKWHHTGKGSGFFFMQPNKVIEPLRFRQIGYDELKKHISKQIIKFEQSVRQASA